MNKLLLAALFAVLPTMAMFKPVDRDVKNKSAQQIGNKKRAKVKQKATLRNSPNPAAQKKSDRKRVSPHGDLTRQSPLAGQMPASDSE